MTTAATGYSASQIHLHWTVFALTLFMFFTGDSKTDLFRAARGGPATSLSPNWAAVHIVVGLAILAAMLLRLWLRIRHGAPAPPASEHAALRWLADVVHVGLYADLVGSALIGLLAYYLFPGLAGLHDLLSRLVLIALVGLHVLGAGYQHFILRTDVMKRMLRARDPAR